MTPERLAALIASYGAEPRRWPEEEQASALALLASGDPTARQSLGEAERLDALLDASAAPAPHAALVGAVLAGFPAAYARRRRWWSGIGLAFATLAGATAGATTMAAAAPAILEVHALSWADEQATAFDPDAIAEAVQ